MSSADVVVMSREAAKRRSLPRRFLRQPAAVAGLVVILVFAIAAAFAPYVAPQSAAATDFNALLAHPSSRHIFGTDELGHDEFSRIVWGARASMQVGFLAMALAMALAVPLGLVAGYYRGWIDTMIARATDVLLAFPFLILAIGLAAILGPSLTTVTIALGTAAVPGLIRVVRGEALSLSGQEFVPAAIAQGASDARVLGRHLLPNMSGTLLVQATLIFPRAIIGEATLSFLGIGVRPPAASWGAMLHYAQSYLSQAPRLAVYPGVAIALAVLAFNLFGDGLHDVLDPRTPR